MITYLRRLTVAVLAVTVFGITACDDGTDPVATATVEVLAYVDANNSNDNDGADVPIEGATITLTMVGSDAGALTQTTGTDGVATFTGVEIGSYTASIEAPASLTGATLASASQPTVAVDEEGATVSASFRYTYNPGAIQGHVFVGSTYADGVPAVSDVTVTVSEGGTELTSVQTDASGMFLAGGLLPGDYDVEVEVPAFLTIGSASQTVTLAAEDTATADFGMDVGTTSTVAEARAAAVGDTVAIVGTAISATAGDSASFSSSSFYMQDDSGISIYLAGVELDVLLGDSILIYGERGEFNGEVQLSTLAAIALGEGTLPTPTDATAADLNAALYQGRLITMQDFLVDSIDGGDIWASEYASGEDVLIYLDFTTGLDSTNFAVGTVYDVTGVASRYNDLLELKPRMTADIVEETSPGMSVADVRAETNGTAVATYGVVTEAGTLEGNGFYMQDATAGIFVYTDFGNIPAGLAIGDVVMVEGERGSYFDTQQIINPTTTEQWVATTPIKPTDVSAAQLSSGDFQGQLVTLAQVTVDSIDGTDLFVVDGATDTAVVRIDSDSGLGTGGFTIGEVYTFTGVVYNSFSTERLKPRFQDDVSGYTPPDTANTVAEARAASDGDPVELTGVVTVTNDSTASILDDQNAYLQDATGGILIRFSTPDTIVAVGDSITVTGNRGSFNEELQVNVDGLVRLGTGTVPTPRSVTAADIENGDYQGELAVLDSVEVTAISGGSITVQDASGTTTVYVDSDTDIDVGTTFTVGNSYEIIGVVSRFNTIFELKPRSQSDITGL